MTKANITYQRKIKYGVIGVIGFCAIWTMLGHMLLQYPEYQQFYGFHPFLTVKALGGLMVSDFFWIATLASIKRVTIGLLVALILAVPIGIAIGFYDRVWMLTNIPIQFLRMISPLSWMPIAILVLPSFEEAIYFLITMSCIWPIVLSTAQGVNRMDRKLINMAKNQGANDIQLLLKIIFPSSLPNIIVGLRLALGISWIILVPAEFLGITNGLGSSINDARDTMEYDRLLAIVIAIGFIGFVLDVAVKNLEKKTHLRFIINK